MSRYDLLQMLDRYQERYPEEGPMVARVVALVEGHADCFARSCQPGHITGSAWVVSADRQRVALVHHRKLQRWLQPGGHADGDSDVVMVAWREATEETGLRNLRLLGQEEGVIPLDVDVHEIPARYDPQGNLVEGAHQHHDIRFLFVASRDDSLVVSEESHAVAWLELDQVRQQTDEESLLRMLEKGSRWLA